LLAALSRVTGLDASYQSTDLTPLQCSLSIINVA